MTNEEILQKAINKACENGWHPKDEDGTEYDWCNYCKVFQCETDDYMKHPYYAVMSPYEIIFNHDFAKAFFGTHEIADCGLLLMPKEFERNFEKRKSNWEDDTWPEIELDYPQYCYNQHDPECSCGAIPAWKFHLQQMVLEEELPKYLAHFLK